MNILEECYSISERYASEDAKELLHERLINSRKVKQQNPINEIPFSNEVVFNDALLLLASEPIGAKSAGMFPNQMELDKMSDCAEKNYLLALLALRSGMDDEGRISAMNYLNKAHDYSPNDPRIRILESILQSI